MLQSLIKHLIYSKNIIIKTLLKILLLQKKIIILSGYIYVLNKFVF